MRVLINTLPLYGKGEGLRTYTSNLLTGLHRIPVDMEWHVTLAPDDIERLELDTDPRFKPAPMGAWARPSHVPGLRFAWRNTLDHVAISQIYSHGYDVLHYLDSYGPLIHGSDIPLVLTVHDLMPLENASYHSGWVSKYLAALMRRTIPNAHAIIAVSDATAQAVVKLLGVPSTRVHVVPLGVEERFRPAEPAELARISKRYNINTPYVITVGTIEPRKNIARLVRAFANAKQRYHLPHHLLIAGKYGWKCDDVVQAIDEVALGQAIRVLGFVPQEDIAPLIAGADVLAFPSLEEGFGLPTLEGMACGTAVLVSRTSPIARIIEGAVEFVEPTRTDELTTTLGYLCTDATRRLQLRQAGLERAKSYTWDQVATSTVEVYQRVAVSYVHYDVPAQR